MAGFGRRLAGLFALGALAQCAPVEPASERVELVIRNVSVVDTAEGRMLPHQDVLVRDGRILDVRATGRPVAARIDIDGRGKFLMAGLADMHTHMEGERFVETLIPGLDLPAGTYKPADLYLPYVANGVLTVQNMAGMPEHFAFREAVQSGSVLGPRVILSAMIDGTPAIWPAPFSHAVKGPQAAAAAVRQAKRDGFDRIKAYSRLSVAEFLAVIEAARALNMPVDGHIPARGAGQTAKFFVPGYRMVAHAEEFMYQSKDRSDAEIDAFAALMQRNGTWLTPTLTLYRQIVNQARDVDAVVNRPEVDFIHPATRLAWMPPRNPYQRYANPTDVARLSGNLAYQQQLVKRFADRGVPLLAGTDALVPGVLPGFALHDELVELVAAGLTPAQALDAATRRPAEFLGRSEEFGRVVPGLSAEMLLLDANPLVDVANTRTIAGVILKGRWLQRRYLDARLAELRQRHRATADGLAPQFKALGAPR